jgi:cytochrome c peroxidase
MEKRRVAVRLLLPALALFGAAHACEPALEGARLESKRYVVAYKAAPSIGEFFSVEVVACAKPGHALPEELKVDAQMPEHRHGMNYAPAVRRLAPGRWRAEGLMFHMPGEWELSFELRGGGASERLSQVLQLSEFPGFSKEEMAKIMRHGPWPPPQRQDPSNRVSGRNEAIALGEKLFFEPRLSGSGSVLCATCHVPFRAFQDARPRALGLAQVDRNTPSLLNVRFYRWYGWDGAHDSLWSQSLRPLLDAREMNASAAHVAGVLRSLFPSQYEKAFGTKPSGSDEELLVDAGKALAAFQETLVSARTPFDDFRDAVVREDREGVIRYPLAAQRGLRIFVGKGNCTLCHLGPHFTNGEFADTGVGFFAAPGRVDPGRHAGIKRLKESGFNLLGRYNDDARRAGATGTSHVEAQHRNFGEWRVPSLRNVARTAPYMHDGSLATLRDVVVHYSELNEERLHADGERILKRLGLTPGEIDDLVEFLRTLSAPDAQ